MLLLIATLPVFAIGGSTVLLKKGKVVKENLERENVTTEEIKTAARSTGIESLAEVKMAIPETDGKISIIPK